MTTDTMPLRTRGYAETSNTTGPVTFTASTPGVKRDGLDLRTSGWRTDRWAAAGAPVLWSHDTSRLPIGSGVATIRGDALRVAVSFDQDDDFARQVEGKVRRGMLRAVSVGWGFVDSTGRALDPWQLSAEQIRDQAYYDLCEVSVVAVPADPDALAEQRAALRRLAGPAGTVPDPDLRAARGLLDALRLPSTGPDPARSRPAGPRATVPGPAERALRRLLDAVTLPGTR